LWIIFVYKVNVFDFLKIKIGAKTMKILYIAKKYDYGDPKRGFSFAHYNFYDSLIKMNNKQHQVVYFPFDEIMLENGRDAMNKMLIERVFQEKPDFCFFCISFDEIKKETIREITNKSMAIILNWFTDDHWRFDNFSKYWAFYFNWISTTDSQAVEKYYKIGYRNVVKTQWAYNHFLYKPLNPARGSTDKEKIQREGVSNGVNLPKIYDVSFVGKPHGNRKKIIKRIKKAGIDINCWGKGWPNGRISQKEMIKIFSQSKINLNLTKSSSVYFLKSIVKIFLKRRSDKSIKIDRPHYWFGNFKSILGKRREQIKGRNFEVPGCGGFLLSGYGDNLGDYYQIDKEIVCYKNINELIEKIRYYLEHDEEREKIAMAGYQRTLGEHTYEKRFEQIFKTIGLIS